MRARRTGIARALSPCARGTHRPPRAPRRRAAPAARQLVESLLDVAHHKKGQLQRNAAICLARLAKNARCMQLIRDNHGMEILMQYVKPTA